MIFNKRFSEISIGDVNKLGENKIEESIVLDYKRDPSSNKDIAKDVSAFANSEGGVIIYGVDEDENHLPVSVTGVAEEDIKEKIENVILTGIRPRLHCTIKPVLVNEPSVKRVLVVLIPKSLNAPHMVSMDRDNRYYKRFNFSSVPMEEHEVRALFERSNSIVDRVDKELKTRNYGLMVPDESKGWWNFIACPLFLDDALVPISHEYRRWLDPTERRYWPIQSNPFLPSPRRPWFHGFLMEERVGNELYSGMEVTRQGIIAYSNQMEKNNLQDSRIPSFVLTQELLAFLGFANELYEKAGYYGTVKLVLGLANIQGFYWAVKLDWRTSEQRRILREQHLPPITRKFTVPNDDSERGLLAKDVLDQPYQAFGFWQCDYFDKEGKLIPR